MSVKSSELKMEQLKDKFNKKAELLVDKEVKSLLTKIKKKHKYDSIKMTSGMGTWVFDVKKDGISIDLKNSETDTNNFKELDEFLRFMAGEYDIYSSDCLV
jgi:hypothetical protein